MLIHKHRDTFIRNDDDGTIRQIFTVCQKLFDIVAQFWIAREVFPELAQIHLHIHSASLTHRGNPELQPQRPSEQN